MKKQHYYLILFIGLLILSSHFAHAAGVGEWIANQIPDSVTKSLEAIRIFTYDFLSIILDIFTVVLFIIWILLIGAVIYGIIYIVNLPKQLGANNFQDAIIKIANAVWTFIK